MNVVPSYSRAMYLYEKRFYLKQLLIFYNNEYESYKASEIHIIVEGRAVRVDNIIVSSQMDRSISKEKQ